MKALEKWARSFLIPFLSTLPPLAYFPLDRSLSFEKDVGVHKDGGVVVADAWYWFASVDYRVGLLLRKTSRVLLILVGNDTI